MQNAWKLVIYDVPAHRILRAQNETRFWDIAIYDVPAFARPRALQSLCFTKHQYFLYFIQAKMHVFKQIITFTSITSTWDAQTQGKMSAFLGKTYVSLVKSMVFHAPGPLPGPLACKPDLAGERKAQLR